MKRAGIFALAATVGLGVAGCSAVAEQAQEAVQEAQTGVDYRDAISKGTESIYSVASDVETICAEQDLPACGAAVQASADEMQRFVDTLSSITVPESLTTQHAAYVAELKTGAAIMSEMADAVLASDLELVETTAARLDGWGSTSDAVEAELFEAAGIERIAEPLETAEETESDK